MPLGNCPVCPPPLPPPPLNPALVHVFKTQLHFSSVDMQQTTRFVGLESVTGCSLFILQEDASCRLTHRCVFAHGTVGKVALFKSVTRVVADTIVFCNNHRTRRQSQHETRTTVLPRNYTTLHLFNGLFPGQPVCLQCFDAVGWEAGRASSL